MTNKNEKRVHIQTVEETTLLDLADKISDIVDHDDIAYFIALLDKMYESWEVSEQLIKHFKSVELIYNSALEAEEKEDLSPKSLLEK